ncbi:hypothetical protein ACFW17_33950 [Streptomyces sp. NPDC058961]
MNLAVFDLDNTLINRQGALADWAAAFCCDRRLDKAAEQHLDE